jgi:FkbM family methyltransferase
MLGINDIIANYVNGAGYETRYDNSFSATLRPGDCVWDVGANVGYYTKLFSERVGSEGTVFAFEPSPENFIRLTNECSHLGNVRMHQSGLGRENGTLSFQQGSDDLGATSRVLEKVDEGIEVDIRSGMSLIRDSDAMSPNAVKIDVEGFEYEVLQGLDAQLGALSLRSIGIEVHFGILKERGMAQAPQQIEKLLQRYGFDVSWPDSSHILATRHSQ